MKKILIPTDFSDNARDALAYVLEFVKKEEAEIHILHVVYPIMITVGDVSVLDVKSINRLVSQAEDSMKALKMFSEEYFDVENINNIILTTHVKTGDVVNEIRRTARKSKVDLIIMGTQGKGHSYLDKLLGTVTTKMIEQTPCPMILIPKEYVYQTIDNVIFSTNLDHGDPYELNKALKILEPHSPLVKVLYIRKNDQVSNDSSIIEFEKYVVGHTSSIKTEFSSELGPDIEEAILSSATKNNAELIIMHRSRKSFFKRLFGGSHTKRMLSRIEIPLMIIN